jgi:protein-disulfide isomerase
MNEVTQESQAPAPRADSKNPYLIPASIVIAGLFIAGAIVAGGGVGKGTAVVAPTGRTLEAQVTPVTDKDHVYGSRDADVFLIEYSDYQCPFCTRFHQTVMDVIEKYDGRVAWVYRHLPLESIHPEARPAALAGECIAEQKGSEGFFAFTNAVFEQNLTLSRDTYVAQATKIGVDVASFEECIDSGKYNALVDEHMANAEDIGGTGTPFNVLLTKKGDIIKFSGAQPIDRVDAFVQRALNSLTAE